MRPEIIKVRDLVPHIGTLPEAFTLKLFSEAEPSSSEDVTRPMRGQTKRLSRSYLRRNGGKFSNAISLVQMFSALPGVFLLCEPWFAFCSLGCSFIYRSFGFTEFKNKQTTTATVMRTSAMAAYACLILFPFIAIPLQNNNME